MTREVKIGTGLPLLEYWAIKSLKFVFYSNSSSTRTYHLGLRRENLRSDLRIALLFRLERVQRSIVFNNHYVQRSSIWQLKQGFRVTVK